MSRYRSPKEKEANKLRMREVGKDPEYRAARAAYAKARKTRRKHWLNKYKEAKGCTRCGVKGPAVIYDWHHIESKSFELNSESILKSLRNLFTEIKKCILVCSNCHRIIHMEERQNGS